MLYRVRQKLQPKYPKRREGGSKDFVTMLKDTQNWSGIASLEANAVETGIFSSPQEDGFLWRSDLRILLCAKNAENGHWQDLKYWVYGGHLYISEKMSCQFLFVLKCAVTSTEDLVYCRGAVASTVLNLRQGASERSFSSWFSVGTEVWDSDWISSRPEP